MTSVFISYSRKDRSAADYIVGELHNRGADVFIDHQKLVAGENFIGRLGKEIENCDYFILILSPRSVVSEWVKAEASWAVSNRKKIIPVLLEPASLTDFFFLVHIEQVDFQRWNQDGNVDESIIKLANGMGLPENSITKEVPVPEALVVSNISQSQEIEESLTSEIDEKDKSPAFARGDISELFLTATEIADENPEQACFLYQRVVETDPNFMQGKVQNLVNREISRLKPARISHLLRQAQKAMKRGDWKQGAQIGKDILVLDKNNSEAFTIIETCEHNTKCQPIYQHAFIAAKKKRWKAANTLLRDVVRTCPDYGDPSNILTNLPLQADFSNFIHEVCTITGHFGQVYSVAFSPDGKLLASASEDGIIKLWNIPDGKEFLTLSGHSRAVNLVTFSPDGKLLASASDDKTIKLWDMSFGKKLLTLSGHYRGVLSIAFSPDGKLLASASEDGLIKLWNILDGKEFLNQNLFSLPSLRGDFCVAISPNGKLLASASYDNSIVLCKIPNGLDSLRLSGHSSFVNHVAFSPDGELLASASDDTTIKLWNMPDGKELLTLSGHSGRVLSVTFSPVGRLLASASHDGTIKLWDMSNGKELLTLPNNCWTSRFSALDFSPDGKLLASAPNDKTVRLWGM